jgi:hypothetical protein
MNASEFSGISHQVRQMFALITWRVTQGVYRFDSEVFDALSNVPITGEIPFEVLLRLPEWCVYIETPGFLVDDSSAVIYGVWVYVDAVDERQAKLVFVLDTAGECSFSIDLKPGTAKDWAEANTNECARLSQIAMSALSTERTFLTTFLERFLPFLLYICSQNAEFGTGPVRPTNPKAKRVKGGERLFPPERVTTWDVGIRMGSALRKARARAADGFPGEVHQSHRGHIRCAHWHGFRTGPMKGKDGSVIPTCDRRMEVRWMPPLAIKLTDVQDLPTTIRPVL